MLWFIRDNNNLKMSLNKSLTLTIFKKEIQTTLYWQILIKLFYCICEEKGKEIVQYASVYVLVLTQ